MADGFRTGGGFPGLLPWLALGAAATFVMVKLYDGGRVEDPGKIWKFSYSFHLAQLYSNAKSPSAHLPTVSRTM